jgi:hypothetical protein
MTILIILATLRNISLGLLADLAHPAHEIGWGADPGSLMLIGLGFIAAGLLSRIGSNTLTRLFSQRFRSF